MTFFYVFSPDNPEECISVMKDKPAYGDFIASNEEVPMNEVIRNGDTIKRKEPEDDGEIIDTEKYSPAVEDLYSAIAGLYELMAEKDEKGGEKP